MPHALADVAHLFTVGDRMLDRCVGDFDAAAWAVTDAHGHDARWITGHLAFQRRRIARMLGLAIPEDAWEAAFQRGTSPAAVPAAIVPATLVAAFHDAHARCAARWDAVGAEELAKPLGRTVPDGSDTIGGAIRFLAWHEAYHLGQLGLLRRLAGRPGIA